MKLQYLLLAAVIAAALPSCEILDEEPGDYSSSYSSDNCEPGYRRRDYDRQRSHHWDTDTSDDDEACEDDDNSEEEDSSYRQHHRRHERSWEE